MKRAVELGEQARVIAPPNPWVGCIIVKNGRIIAEGATEAPGSDHAEAVALKKAGNDAKGATVYVTLEPCAHQGRTAPCTQKLINAGVQKVIIGIEDPDPISGEGIALLREAGIDVEIGEEAEAITQSLAPYLHHRQTGLPWCVGKAATSLDGRVAAADGSSQWISSDEARVDAHHLRAQSQAILVGSGTALRDSPRLTVRHGDTSVSPLRVVLDRRGRLPEDSPLLQSDAPTLVVTSPNCSDTTVKMWETSGAEVLKLSSLPQLLEILGKRGVLQLLIEGGSQILGAFLQENLLNQLTLYLGNCILGEQGLPLFGKLPISSLSEAGRYRLINTQPFGDTVRLDYVPKRSPTE